MARNAVVSMGGAEGHPPKPPAVNESKKSNFPPYSTANAPAAAGVILAGGAAATAAVAVSAISGPV